jgi:PAS domain S-box-containing protein
MVGGPVAEHDVAAGVAGAVEVAADVAAACSADTADERWPSGAASQLLELAVDLACVIGYDGRFQSLSEGWTELLGRSCDGLVGLEVASLVHPDHVESSEAAFAAGREDGALSRFANRLLAADGTSRWLVWSAVAEPAEERFHAVARDITPQREAEEQMRESETRYHDLIESSHDIVQSIDPEGGFEFVNRSWHRHLGYTPEELPNLTLFDIVDEVDHNHCSLLIGQIMSGKSFEQVEVTFVAKDGRKFPVEGNATGRFKDGQFVGTHTFFRDVSERKQAEAMAAQYQQQLEQEVAERSAALVQSEKLATLGRLSAGMAHELNNPAAAAVRGAVRLRDTVRKTCGGFIELARLGLSAEEIAALVEALDTASERAKVPDGLDPVTRSDREGDIEDWLSDRVSGDVWELASELVGLGLTVGDLEDVAGRFSSEKVEGVLRLMAETTSSYSLLEQIAHGAQRISEIVTALKDYSYMDRAPVQDVDVHAGLDNTLVMLQGELKRGVEVARRYGDDVPLIVARGSELNQVWTNLIDNAVDAMDGQGHLIIRTRADAGDVVVEIEDDGPGIAADHVDHVFDPFFTTKLPGQGTGLGLNISYNIVRGSGGEISVESRPGSTVFRVRLPAHHPDYRPTDGADGAGATDE